MLTNWSNDVGALNNVCFKIELPCADVCRCGWILDPVIEFKLFITVAPQKIPLARGIYGHELVHLLQMISAIENADFCPRDCCEPDCSNIEQCKLDYAKSIWNTIGPAFRHSYPGSGFPEGPPWGTPVEPAWPGFPFVPSPPGVQPPPNVPAAVGSAQRRPATPFHGKDGWFCPMDTILFGNGTWPDWQFNPIPPQPNPPQPNR